MDKVTILSSSEACERLKNCMERMCVTDSHEEVVNLFVYASMHLHDLYMSNHFRIFRSFGDYDGK